MRWPEVVAPQLGLISFRGIGQNSVVLSGPAPRRTIPPRVISRIRVILYRPGGTSIAPDLTLASASRKACESSAMPSPLAPNSFTLMPRGMVGIGFSPQPYPANEKSGNRLAGDHFSPSFPQSAEYSGDPAAIALAARMPTRSTDDATERRDCESAR